MRNKRNFLWFMIAGLVLAGCSGSETVTGDNGTPAGEGAARPASEVSGAGFENARAEQLYQENCAMCHDGSMAEAPTREAIESNTPEAIYASLTTGVMQPQALMISSFEKELLANYLGAKTKDAARRAAAFQACEGELGFSPGGIWGRWGHDRQNTRFLPAEVSGFNRENVSKLKLKWAFGLPAAVRARSQPAVTREALFTGSQDGTVYALDPKTGCVWWRFFADTEVRNAPVLDLDGDGVPQAVYFGDFNGTVYALDPKTGDEQWRVSVKEHPATTLTGSMALHEGRLFVPVSSLEVVSAFNPTYECCTFRGGIAALDTSDGSEVWRFHTVPEPQQTEKNINGVQMWGPSGAPVWTVPTVDAGRGLLYVGTGENYSSPATGLSDAILAISIETGELVWTQQTIEGDAWNGSCVLRAPNCPEENGPDFDFGAPALLVQGAGGKDMIIAGQKSGMVFGLDPDEEGRVVWSQRAGMGGYNGGIHWGMASNGETVFVGIADTPGHHLTTGPQRQGVHTFDVRSGEPGWSVVEAPTCPERKRRCQTAISAAVTATPEIIFAGALNGWLKAYAADTGEELWSYDTHRSFETVNGVEARGGSVDATGPVVMDGMLFVNSGYDKFGNIPGNVLLAFEVEEQAE